MTATEPVNQAATEPRAINPDALNELLGRVIADAGGALILPLALIGDRLGLFAALASGGRRQPGNWPSGPDLPSVTCVNGCSRWRRPAT